MPAQDLKVLVYDGTCEPPPARVPREISPGMLMLMHAKIKAVALQAQGRVFTKMQVAGRVRQLKLLFEDGPITDDFYGKRIAECKTVQ